jgi:hypothetical protein
MTVRVMSFGEALEASQTYAGKRHILLGNGFSIAYDSDSFSYGRLFDVADFSSLSVDARPIFDDFGTTDFEHVIEALRGAAKISLHYEPQNIARAERIRADSELLKDALAEVLARRHPDYVGSVEPAEFASARRFLSNFNRIYTVNYDLLLYWTSMQDGEPRIPRNDGFAESEEEPGARWVSWRPMAAYNDQRIFYLHGGLHLFDAGTELRKITWSRTSVRLVDQIRESLEEGAYPLVVTEGTSQEKYEKILHAAYLNHALRSFSRIQGALFVYGLSMSENDEHILRRIEEGGLSHLFVGLYGSPGSAENEAIIQRSTMLSAARNKTKPLSVDFYDSSSAAVWRS